MFNESRLLAALHPLPTIFSPQKMTELLWIPLVFPALFSWVYHFRVTKALTASWSWSYVQNTSNRCFLTIAAMKSSRNQLVPSPRWTTGGRKRQIKCLFTSQIGQELAGKRAVFHLCAPWFSGVNESSLISLRLLCKTKPSRKLRERSVCCSMSPG